MSMRTYSLLAAWLLAVGGQPATAGLDTAFTYQGQLRDGGRPASGNYDLQFTIYDAMAEGNIVAGPVTNLNATVSDGVFVAIVDFGPGAFSTNPRWLDLAVRTNGGGAFTRLTPRQALTPTPYALQCAYATAAANVDGPVPATSLSGTIADARLGPNVARLDSAANFTHALSAAGFSGDGAGLTNLPGTSVLGTVPSAVTAGYAAVAGTATNGGTGSFAGSFAGSGAGLTNLSPAIGAGWGFAVPQSFGAVGDGTHDDTAALQMWINYCAANRLEARLPAVSQWYVISNWLMLTAPITIRGPGESVHFPGPAPRAHIRQNSPGAGVFLIMGQPYNAAPPDCIRLEQVFCSAAGPLNLNAAIAFDGADQATDDARVISCGAANFLYGVLNASACVLRIESCSFDQVGWGYYQGPGRYYTSTNPPVLNANEIANSSLGGYSNSVWLAHGELTLEGCDVGGGGRGHGPPILQTGGLLHVNGINLENPGDFPAIQVSHGVIQLLGGQIGNFGSPSPNSYSLAISDGTAIILGTELATTPDGFAITETNAWSSVWSAGSYRERLTIGSLTITNFTGMFTTTIPSQTGWPVPGAQPGGPWPGVFGAAPTLIFSQRLDGLNQTAIYAPVGMEAYYGTDLPTFVDLLQYQKDQVSGLSGNGAGLTNLNGAKVSGSVRSAVTAQYATVAAGTTNGGRGVFSGSFAGDGAGLTNLKAGSLTGVWSRALIAEGLAVVGGLSVNSKVLFIGAGAAKVGIGTTNPTLTLQVNGSVGGVGAYQNLSDGRYKQNVAPLADALAKVRALRGVQYDWRTNEYPQLGFDPGRQLGLIAQEVEPVLPEAVTRNAEGVYSIAYGKLIPVLVEAVKEQQKEIELREAEMRRLEQASTELEARLKALEKALHTGGAAKP